MIVVTAGNDRFKGILSSFHFKRTFTFVATGKTFCLSNVCIFFRSVATARFGRVQEFQLFFFYFEPKAIAQSAYHLSYGMSPSKRGSIRGTVCDYLTFNPLNAELNPICHLLVLLGAHPILHISRIRVKNPASYI